MGNQGKSRPRLDIMSVAGTLYEILRKIANFFLELGGTNEMIEAVNTDEEKQKQIAMLIAGKLKVVEEENLRHDGNGILEKIGNTILSWRPFADAASERESIHFELGQLVVVVRHYRIPFKSWGFIYNFSHPKTGRNAIGVMLQDGQIERFKPGEIIPVPKSGKAVLIDEDAVEKALHS